MSDKQTHTRNKKTRDFFCCRIDVIIIVYLHCSEFYKNPKRKSEKLPFNRNKKTQKNYTLMNKYMFELETKFAILRTFNQNKVTNCQ